MVESNRLGNLCISRTQVNVFFANVAMPNIRTVLFLEFIPALRAFELDLTVSKVTRVFDDLTLGSRRAQGTSSPCQAQS